MKKIAMIIMFLVVFIVLVGKALATPASGFVGTTLAEGRFDER
ncbi:MAG TPA: hypothetical protein VLK23_06340 [Thermodesulfobacteriota bacterium]|nr:hypothetical protein [Thermodesulfobacteriota bacterium]